MLLAVLAAACTPADAPQPTPITLGQAGTPTIPTATTAPTTSPAPSPSPTLTPQLNCTESALFVADVTIADNTNVQPGQSFTKTWQLRNTGTCSWNSGYALVFTGGDQMNSPASVPLAETGSNETLNLSVALAAPSADGFYTGLYEIHNPQGQAIPIGVTKIMWVKIAVGNVVVAQPTLPLAAAATIVSGPLWTPHPIKNCKPEQNGGIAAQLLALINNARANAGLPGLSVNAQLTASAQSHSEDMACHSLLSHTGSNGSSIYDRIAAAGYSPSYWEEIIFASGSAQQAFNWWMNDPPHRDAILSPKVDEMGAGYAYLADSQFGSYYTVDFGRP